MPPPSSERAAVGAIVGLRVPIRPALRRSALACTIGGLAGLAWLALWWTDVATHSVLHLGHGSHHGSLPQSAVLFTAGWTVMTVAMMLPTTLPILSTYDALARDRGDRVLLLALLVAGYIVVWTAFGAAAYAAARGIHRFAGPEAALPWGLDAAPALLVTAGLFQFTPLKYRCLDKCRSPFSFVLSYWQGARHRWQAFRLGAGHGWFCVGCCWALMLLMFAVGTWHLAWMLVLGAVMAIEKNASWGARMSVPLGVLLVAAGMAVWIVA